MRAADQWNQIEAQLSPSWGATQLSFTPEGSLAEAAAVLAPLQPLRVGDELRWHVSRLGGGPEKTRNILGRLDRKRVWGTLAVHEVVMAATEPLLPLPRRPGTVALADAWDELIAALPPDWSDLLCELELDSSDQIARAALLGAPTNPTRVPGEIALRFRASGKQGYGVAPPMARRCFERMDAEGITGRITVVYDLSDTANDMTQGPVWRVAGRSV
jgi:hypothetical protein